MFAKQTAFALVSALVAATLLVPSDAAADEGIVVALLPEGQGAPALGGADLRWYSAELSAASYWAGNTGDAIAALQAVGAYAYVPQDQARALYTPNDPLLDEQWGVDAIRLREAWDVTRGSPLARVAVLDTGITYDHPDLASIGSIIQINHQIDGSAPQQAGIGVPVGVSGGVCGPDATFAQPFQMQRSGDIIIQPGSIGAVPGYAPDGHGHGTHVAGTVAAHIGNNEGVAGMGRTCIQSVKVLDDAGRGNWPDIAVGITYAASSGSHIISMSLGGFFISDADLTLLEAAVDYAQDRGVLVVAAAANSGCGSDPSTSDRVAYPARLPGVLTVAALAPPGDEAAWFSSCGPTVDIAGPGQDIISTTKNGGYGSKSGTSMATPHVSGVAALVKSRDLHLPGHTIACILTATSDDLGPAGHDNVFGHGRMDAKAAVDAATDPASVGC